ncbi:uncharacterized protein TRAVEDRAFT_125324 [Trametes versicolor FP-101664 SS1]|uniref:uncharacterized protein n=1 Tax=Trametes versicolor (strain FP-101664) TaxID=717944 RepID=UPI0004622766|nr:uncharacterized protein TRAVEDRAFT_125324 [Trametes versicolor FP-101664 SS1]EIW57414.1 hypothetical protein TRAVEDRAFT_125324 [Trametes versicolor FP-101664 SS1]
MSSPRDIEARRLIREGYIAYQSASLGVHTVTFQPKGEVDANEDRIVTDIWNLHGQRWLLLAVFDGHIGSAAVQYTSQAFPAAIRTGLQEFIANIVGPLDRSNITAHQAQVTKIIQKAIMKFDNDLGDAVRELCPRPEELTEEQARCLIAEHREILERAFHGTTMAFTLINVDQRFMWAAGVSDSTDAPFDDIIPRIKTPPYIVNGPSVCFTDLAHFWPRQSKIFLFSDGVDNLVDGWLVFKPREHSGGDPVDVVSALLADHIEPRIEGILGHPVIPRWSGEENNLAVDVLGNLLGGTDVERLEAVTDLERLNKPGWPFHIDDTSIIVWPLTDQ